VFRWEKQQYLCVLAENPQKKMREEKLESGRVAGAVSPVSAIK
jgi:hypothetical protein